MTKANSGVTFKSEKLNILSFGHRENEFKKILEKPKIYGLNLHRDKEVTMDC